MSVRDVEIRIPGVTLRGKLFLPEGRGPYPAVILQSGLGGPADSIYPLTQAFVGAGLATLVYDHRYTGISDGEPRQLFDPWQQCRDLRHVITWLGLQPEVDKARIGLWGISIGGANALFVTAMDKRVKAVVSLIPPVSGWSARKLQPADVLAELDARIPEDRETQLLGGEALTIRLHGQRMKDDPVMFSDEEGLEFVENMLKASPSFRNAITLSTLDCLYEMEVQAYAERIGQPLLMVLASEDTVAPVEEAREMYGRVPEPKEKIEYPGQHYEILSNHLPEILGRTADWLARTL
ncbi:MAG TPA: alpha/beta fold hydrolase [Rhizobiales bacterium]|nr:alpha/beta fold hydrolase [Hyphomicrobiales bacterium]